MLTVIREGPTGEFAPEVLAAADNVYLDGFWQSEDYFKEHEQLIREDFTLHSHLSQTGATLSKEIAHDTSVSMHVRRGDYVNSTFMYSHGPDMYEKAIEIITREIGDVRIFVFSDEPDWCEANLRFDYPMMVVRHDDGLDHSLEDLRLMSLCDHHVVANSSFGWWGAWLDPRVEKIVVAPKRWFRDPGFASAERRIPRDWIGI